MAPQPKTVANDVMANAAKWQIYAWTNNLQSRIFVVVYFHRKKEVFMCIKTVVDFHSIKCMNIGI